MDSKNAVMAFRPYLNHAVHQFLEECGAETSDLWSEIVSEVTVELSRYREEGSQYFPVVFISGSMDDFRRSVASEDFIRFGDGVSGTEVVRRAMKQCAQLGEGRFWAIYFLIEETGVTYGLFRANGSPLAPTAFERMRRLRSSEGLVIGMLQLAENVVELRLSNGAHRYIYLSGARLESENPVNCLGQMIRSATRDVAPSLRKQFEAFFYRVGIDVIHGRHGAIVVIVPAGKPIPDFLSDGVLFDPPIDLLSRVEDYEKGRSEDAIIALQAQSTLLKGMISVDGITVLRSDGCILGYNVFIQAQAYSHEMIGLVGGARRRTFEALCSHLGKGVIGAFYRSQDGNCAFREHS